MTVVPSTCRLTTPTGPPGKVERANRWRVLCEGGCGCGVECGSSAAEESRACMCARAILGVFVHVFMKATLVFVGVLVCFVYACIRAFVFVCVGGRGEGGGGGGGMAV